MPTISSFEVFLQDIAPSESSSASEVEIKPQVQRTRPVVRNFTIPQSTVESNDDIPTPIPSAVQGFFLLISNQTANALPVRITFVTSSDEGAMALSDLVPAPSGTLPYAFLAITNTQDPTVSGNTGSGINTSGIYFSGLIPSGNLAYIDLPERLPPSGTFLFSLVPNYANPNVVKLGPVGRGYVRVGSPGGYGDVLLSPQTRVVFFNYNSTGVSSSEAAYDMQTSTGRALFTLSGLA